MLSDLRTRSRRYGAYGEEDRFPPNLTGRHSYETRDGTEGMIPQTFKLTTQADNNNSICFGDMIWGSYLRRKDYLHLCANC